MFLKNLFIITSLLFFSFQSCSQKVDPWQEKAIDSSMIMCADYNQNNFTNTAPLVPFFKKLYKIKNKGKGHVNIVHIGDSHIQADMMTTPIRTELQNYYGNAGRGLVFPYQLVKTNAPVDLIFNSKSIWKGNRVSKIDTMPACGIAGFGMLSRSYNPSFSFNFRTINEQKATFDQVRFFISNNVSELTVEYNDNQLETICLDTPNTSPLIDLKMPASGFKITFPTTDSIKFYGAILEKKDVPGILYHTIGANGAKYSDYNKTPLFWEQLKVMEPDCYIISLGTNEAQDQNLTGPDFIAQVKVMVNNIRQITPSAVIIISTPPQSYFKQIKPNPVLAIMATAISNYCLENNVVCWDLYNICKGSEGAVHWKSGKLLRSDLVHFSKEGYILQGDLFTRAFAKAWNEYLNK